MFILSSLVLKNKSLMLRHSGGGRQYNAGGDGWLDMERV